MVGWGCSQLMARGLAGALRPGDGGHALALWGMPEYWSDDAIVAEEHQGIPIAASVWIYPMHMATIHLEPRILGAHAKRLVPLQPAQLPAFEGAQ
jgi:hypothetical protein